MQNKLHPFADFLKGKTVILWLMLAFHAGYLNAGGFLSSHLFVSHMTGMVSSIGMNTAELLLTLEAAVAPILFIFGSAVAGILIDRDTAKESVLFILLGVAIMIVLNVAALIGGVTGFFGTFGEPLMLQRDFILLFILTFMCGLQNGLFTSLTAGAIRSTHITGTATDLGLGLIKQWNQSQGHERLVDKKKNWLRLGLILAFTSGSMTAAIIFNRFEYWGFAGSVVLSLGILSMCYEIVEGFSFRRSKASIQTAMD
jgi:uncharacterized membrane protein YoaK (UPF0700 family)